jgi:hypothetical protein
VPDELISDEVSAGVPQASLAVGAPNDGVLRQSIVEEPSVDVQNGALVSTTVTVADVVAVLLQASVAVHVRVTL